jgi:8-oxo-dGTP pyrophosphatase MutT (NUDIX family)
MAVKIYFEDEFKLVEDTTAFSKDYTQITAAGGVVIDDEGRILLIFRRGKWDLPKGKLEEGELVEDCAEREVKEETGLAEIKMERFLLATYHTYTEKNKSILKDTHWYLFRAHGTQDVIPQTEEDIVEIEWVYPSELIEYTDNTYELIKDVLRSADLLQQ